ncbi:MAG: type II CRISPR RNA-guided endonuclease Cas9 [Candidatus Kapaibacterium sp.]
MKKILGLDIGTNSIGWALITEKDSLLHNIDAIGSRIIPEKDEHRDFEKGRTITKNATRRQKRGMRRLNDRFKQRRNNLIKLCFKLGIIPTGLEPLFNKAEFIGNKILLPQGSFQNGDKQYSPYEIYLLRSKALKEKVSLEDLFRIIYHLNQRRGFKSNKKAKNEDLNTVEKKDDIKTEEHDITIENVKIISVEITGNLKGRTKKDEYLIILEDGRKANTDKYIFKKYCGENIILEIKKDFLKTTKETKYTFSFPNNWQKGRKELNDAIANSGGFPGEYFYEEYLKAKNENKLYNFKVRENVVNRELYENEFQAIWEKQKELWLIEGIDIDNLLRKNEAFESIIPKNNFNERKIWSQKGLGEFVRKYIIYYQRDLKSQIKTISDCQFEEKYVEILDKETGESNKIRNGPKTCPKSHPDFQEFRIWQQIHNLIIFNENEESIEIGDDLKVILFDYLNKREEADKKDIDKEIKKHISNFSYSNIAEKTKWTGNRTKSLYRKIFKRFNYDGSSIFDTKELYLRLWHLIYSVGDEKGIRNGILNINSLLRKQFSEENIIPEELVIELIKIDYSETQYASLSLKAINNLLPLMRCGYLYNEDNLTSKVKQRIADFLDDQINDDFDPKTLKAIKTKINISEFKSLSYYEAASLIYGKHSAKQLDKYESPDEIVPVPRHSLRNPVVEQIVNETLMLVKDVWRKYPELKDGEIKIELARELKSSKEEREKIYNSQNSNKEANKRIINEIKEIKGINYNPSLSDIEKIKLWNEQGKRSPYTGDFIQLSDILTESIEIDHIIPRSRFYNDGLINKVVCESHINSDKSNMTAFEYMNTGTMHNKLSYEDFIHSIRLYPQNKRRMLTLKEIPDDFIERQLKETQYIAKRIKEELGKIVGTINVKSTSGHVTNYLKEQWGVSELMRRLIKPRFQRLEDKFSVKLVEESNIIGRNGKPTGKKKTIIKGFSKRYDHRHHALDALIIACTRQGIIQQLNLLNQISTGKRKIIEDTLNESYRKFIPPTGKQDKGAEYFYSLAETAMNKVIVSYKNKKRLVSKGINWYKKFYLEKNRIVKLKQDETDGKQRNWAIKGRLHLETNYGVYDFNNIQRHISKCKLSKLTENKISNIADNKLQNDIQKHINKPEYEGNINNAFNPEGLVDFNKERTIPIYSVRVLEDGIIGKVQGKTPLYNIKRKLEVEKGSNFCVTFYEHPETKERKFDVVSFFDAVLLKTNGENPFQTEKGVEYQKEGYKLLFTLSHNDLVYVPPKNVELSNIDFDYLNVFDKIFRVVKFSDSDFYFQPHNYAKEITIHEGKAKDSKEYKGEFNKGTNGSIYCNENKNKIKDTCIKVFVNRLGDIRPFSL